MAGRDQKKRERMELLGDVIDELRAKDPRNRYSRQEAFDTYDERLADRPDLMDRETTVRSDLNDYEEVNKWEAPTLGMEQPSLLGESRGDLDQGDGQRVPFLDCTRPEMLRYMDVQQQAKARHDVAFNKKQDICFSIVRRYTSDEDTTRDVLARGLDRD